MSASFRRRRTAPTAPVPKTPPSITSGDDDDRGCVGDPSSLSNDGTDDPPSSSQSHQDTRESVPSIPKSHLSGPPRGTKPWTSGTYLTSFGLREVDVILGGGQPLGTCVVIEEDRFTFDSSSCLMKYWCAEGVAQGQTLLLPATKPEPTGMPLPRQTLLSSSIHDDEINGPDSSSSWYYQGEGNGLLLNVGSSPSSLRTFVESLPRNLHLDKFRSRAESTGNSTSGANDKSPRIGFAPIEEGESDEEEEETSPQAVTKDEEEEAEEGLRIAWQYRKSVQRERLGHTMSTATTSKSLSSRAGADGVYCHSYDLSGRMMDQYPADWLETNSNIIFVDDCYCSPCCSSSSERKCIQCRQCGIRMYQHLIKRIRQHPATSSSDDGNTRTVIRLLLRNAPIPSTSIALPLLLSHIRRHSLPVIILLTIRPWSYHPRFNSCLHTIRRTCDAVFQTDSFAAHRMGTPPEFRDSMGILTIPRLATLTSITGHFSCNDGAIRNVTADRYGMKRDRRKLHVRMLHLPPEEYSAGGGSVSGGGVRSGAGRISALRDDDRKKGGGGGASSAAVLQPGTACGGGPGTGKKDLLEF